MGLSRRRFLQLGAASALATLLPRPMQRARAEDTLRVLAPARTLSATVRAGLLQYGLPLPVPSRADTDDAIVAGMDSDEYDVVMVPSHLTARLIGNGAGFRLQPGLLRNPAALPEAYLPGRRMQDPANAYSLPAQVGQLGIIYNPRLQPRPKNSWRELAVYADNVVLPNDPELVMAVLLKAYEALDELARDLKRLRAGAEESFDPVGQLLRSRGGMTIGPSKLVEGTGLAFVAPDEGSFGWGLDYMIPTNSPNSLLAHAFIDAAIQTAPPGDPPWHPEPGFLVPRPIPGLREKARWLDAWEAAAP